VGKKLIAEKKLPRESQILSYESISQSVCFSDNTVYSKKKSNIHTLAANNMPLTKDFCLS